MKRMKQYSKKTDLILANVKNEGDRLRNMHQNRGGHHMPINQGGHFIPPNFPGIMSMPKNSMPLPPPMPNQGYPMMMNQMLPPMGNMPGPNMGMMNPNMGGMGKPQGN